MGKDLFSPMEIDALGEMTNISLGSSATAVSNMLDHRVDITTPHVSVVAIEDFALGDLEPAMGVEIKYVEGLTGSNLMLLRRSDIKVIVDILMGMENSPDEDFELNELTISAVCEVMNQMMGAASTAMSEFLGFPVNISTPVPFELDDMEKFKREHLPQDADNVVVIRFSFKIENAIESEFMNVMSVPLAKELLQGLGLDSGTEEPEAQPEPAAQPAGDPNRQMSQEEIEQMMAQMSGGAPAAQPEPAPSGDRQMTQEEIEQMMAQMAGGAPAAQPEPAPSGDHMMSQEEIEQMMAQMAAEASQPEPEPAPAGDRKMTQEEIEQMMAAQMAAAAPAPTPPPAPQPAPPAGDRMMSQEEIQRMMAAQSQPQPAPAAPTPPPMPEGQQPMQPPYMGQNPYGAPPYGYMPMYYPYPQPPVQPDPKVIETKPVELPQLDVENMLGKEQAENLDLIMDVPLQVTVEIGRSRRKVQDILEFTKGSLVVLDKLAGDQVDLFVNGKCIAKGDVVVIDDNFGVRITEIIKNNQPVGTEAPQKS